MPAPPPAPACPTPEELSQFASQQTDAARIGQLQKHLSACESCRLTVEQLAATTVAFNKKPDERLAADGLAETSNISAVTADRAETKPSVVHQTDLLANRYRRGDEIARGGMGVVYRATDVQFKREVAIKILRPRWRDERQPALQGERRAQAIESFAYEAEITARLQHPGIPPVHELGQLDDGLPFLAMKLVQGQTLHELLQERKSLLAELPRWLQILEQVAQAIGYAHSQGILHRDLKPQNIMVGAFGEVQAMDWGLAKVIGAAERPTFQTTESQDRVFVSQDGDIKGTLQYMSPEQARGEIRRLGPPTDVFGLGAILCQILTGGPPYRGTSLLELREAAYSADLDPALERIRASGADSEIIALAVRCLAPEADSRWPDGTAVAHAIADYRAGVEQRLRQAETDRALSHQQQIEQSRRRLLLIYSAAALLLTIAVASTTLAIVYARSNQAIAEREAKATTALHTSRRQLAANQFQKGQVEYQAGWPRTGLRELQIAVDNHPDDDDLRAAYHRVLADRLIDGGRAILPPLRHNDAITTVDFSSDGRFVLTASDDGTAQVWNAQTGVPQGQVMGHEKSVSFASFSPDGKRVVTASDQTARLWDVTSGEPLTPSLPHGEYVISAVFSPDGRRLLTNCVNGVRIWDPLSLDESNSPLLHLERTYSGKFRPDGEWIAAGATAEGVQVWNSHAGQPKSFVLDHKDVVEVRFSPSGKVVLTVSHRHSTARLWSAEDGSAIGDVILHERGFHSSCFSPDGKRVLLGQPPSNAQVYDAETGRPVFAPWSHLDQVLHVEFSPDGSLALTASRDRAVRIWDCRTGELVAAPLWHNDQVNEARFSPDGRRIVSGGADGIGRIWDLRLPIELPHQGSIGAVNLSSDGRKVATTSRDKTARIWDVQTGDALGEPLLHAAAVTDARFSPDGRRLVTAIEKEAQQWDLDTGQKIGDPLCHEENIARAAYTPDGKHIISSGESAYVWTLAGDLAESHAGLGSIRFSPNRNWIASGHWSGAAHIWQPLSPGSALALRGHDDYIMDLNFNRQGNLLVTGSKDGTARIWNTTTGLPQGAPFDTGEWVVTVQFNPDATQIVTGGHNNYAQIWDIRSGQRLGDPLRHANAVTSSEFDPRHGQRLVTGGGDGLARLWEVRTGTPLGQPMGGTGNVSPVKITPDGQRVVMAGGGNAARIFFVGFDIPFLDDPELTKLWTETVTGEELTADQTFRPLSIEEWSERRAELEKSQRWRAYVAHAIGPAAPKAP